MITYDVIFEMINYMLGMEILMENFPKKNKS